MSSDSENNIKKQIQNIQIIKFCPLYNTNVLIMNEMHIRWHKRKIKGLKLTLQNVPGVLNCLLFGFPDMIYMIHDGNIE